MTWEILVWEKENERQNKIILRHYSRLLSLFQCGNVEGETEFKLCKCDSTPVLKTRSFQLYHLQIHLIASIISPRETHIRLQQYQEVLLLEEVHIIRKKNQIYGCIPRKTNLIVKVRLWKFKSNMKVKLWFRLTSINLILKLNLEEKNFQK